MAPHLTPTQNYPSKVLAGLLIVIAPNYKKLVQGWIATV